MVKFINIALIACMISLITHSQASEFTGAGATFPYPIYSKWAATYHKETGNKLNYQSIGSGAGIKQIVASTVDFGASDKPLKTADLEKQNLFQFPTVMGGIVLAYNLEGFKSNTIKLTSEIVAQIFLGKIKNWNDPAIKEVNPDLNLPDKQIIVVHRSDGSGTTFLFTTYLIQVSKEWKETVGADTSVAWPAGIGGKGNEGVAGFIKQTPGSIGYVEFAYAKENSMPTTQLQNHDGAWVEPNLTTFKAAASHADWTNAKNFHLILTNQPGKESWPIVGATFILVHKKSKDAKPTKATIEFYNWAYKNGDKLAIGLAYVPLPENLKAMIRKAWQSDLQDEDGKSICDEKICE